MRAPISSICNSLSEIKAASASSADFMCDRVARAKLWENSVLRPLTLSPSQKYRCSD